MELMKSGTKPSMMLFEKCIKRSRDGKSIDCKLGLWGVISNDWMRTEQEAFHYWRQYFRDGEYDSILPAMIPS
jgi:hypothetical protein